MDCLILWWIRKWYYWMRSENIGGHETESIVHLKKEGYSSYSNLLIDLIYNSLDVMVYLVFRMQNFNLCTRQVTLELISIEMDIWMNDVILFLVSITTLVFRFFIQFSCFQHLTSLEMLGIERCNKLKSLPKQGLPSSLSCLYITEEAVPKV